MSGRAVGGAVGVLAVGGAVFAWSQVRQGRPPAPVSSASLNSPSHVSPDPDFVPTLPALPSGQIRIGLTRCSGVSAVVVRRSRSGPITLSDGKTVSGGTRLRIELDPAGEGVRLRPDGSSTEVKTAWALLGSDGFSLGAHRFQGALRVHRTPNGLECLNELPLETYLEGVLPGEIPRRFLPAAQEALAVAARTYALAQRGKHQREGAEYDLCDRPHCQNYLGLRKSHPAALAAVRATRGRVVLWRNKLACTFYSADCGGISTTPDRVPLPDLPEGPLPYLQAVSDRGPDGQDFCSPGRFHTWTTVYPAREAVRRLWPEVDPGATKLETAVVTHRDPTGRAEAVNVGRTPVGGEYPPVLLPLSAWEFRRILGPMKLKSTWFDLRIEGEDLVISGRGFGHGLGLCQMGANGLARAGRTHAEILSHYFPGTRLGPIPEKKPGE